MITLKNHRLTLTQDALCGLSLIAPVRPMSVRPVMVRADGKFDVGVSHALYDQLQTASLPRENLSDTVIRLAKASYSRRPAA